MFGLGRIGRLGRKSSKIASPLKHLSLPSSSIEYHQEYHNLQTPVPPAASTQLPKPPTLGSCALKSLQSPSLRLNYIKPLQASITDKEYALPTVNKLNLSVSILDPCAKRSVELPSVLQHKLEIFVPSINSIQKVIEDPPMKQNSVGGIDIEKHAKNVLKYRRRHMNRHKLKKLRKRMKFTYMRLAQRKAKRREKLLQKMQDDIILAAEEWDPKEKAMSVLERARKGGFRIDIFAKHGDSESKEHS